MKKIIGHTLFVGAIIGWLVFLWFHQSLTHAQIFFSYWWVLLILFAVVGIGAALAIRGEK